MTNQNRNVSEVKLAIIILLLFAMTLGAMLFTKVSSASGGISRQLSAKGRNAVITMGFISLPFSKQNRKTTSGSPTQKAQSAMEYLMTYGWAILIIAVVLAALFSLGVFNKGALLGTSCVPSPGFLCSGLTLSSTGAISFQMGQATGATDYNVLLACLSTTASNTISLSGVNFNAMGANGLALPQGSASTYSSNSLLNGQPLTVSNLQCYGTSEIPLSTGGIGQSLSGIIWMAYNNTRSSGPANLYARVGTFSARSTS